MPICLFFRHELIVNLFACNVRIRTDQHYLSTQTLSLYTPYLPENTMLNTIIIVLIVLWALGLVSSYSMGGLIHILLVLAIIAILVRVIQGRPL
jgi:hypothetical protein